MRVHEAPVVCYALFKNNFAVAWTVACQTLLPMGFTRQESWSGLPSPPPGDLANPGIKPTHLLHRQADSSPLSHLGSPCERNLRIVKATFSRNRFSNYAIHWNHLGKFLVMPGEDPGPVISRRESGLWSQRSPGDWLCSCV